MKKLHDLSLPKVRNNTGETELYEFSSRVRYSEVDSNGILKISALVNYLQDCSTFQSEDLGVGIDFLSQNNLGWVLNYWQIDIKRLPKLTDNIVIGTIPYLIKGFLGHRNFYIKDANTGEMIIKANSLWTLLDLKKLLPVRADADTIEKYNCSEKLDMEYTERKVKLLGDFAEGTPIEIVSYMLDTNHHVNNAQYIEMAMAFIPEGRKISRIRIEYKESAYLNDTLIPRIYNTNNNIGVELIKKSTGKVCAACLFETIPE